VGPEQASLFVGQPTNEKPQRGLFRIDIASNEAVNVLPAIVLSGVAGHGSSLQAASQP
jgi:hypothetical protein